MTTNFLLPLQKKSQFLSKLDRVFRVFPLVTRLAQKLKVIRPVRAALRQRLDVVNVISLGDTGFAKRTSTFLSSKNALNVIGSVSAWCRNLSCASSLAVLLAALRVQRNPYLQPTLTSSSILIFVCLTPSKVRGSDLFRVIAAILARSLAKSFCILCVVLLVIGALVLSVGRAPCGSHSFHTLGILFSPSERCRVLSLFACGTNLGFLVGSLYGRISHYGRSLVRLVRDVPSVSSTGHVPNYAVAGAVWQ